MYPPWPRPGDEADEVVFVVPAMGSSVTEPRKDWLSTRIVEGMKPRGSFRARRRRVQILAMSIHTRAPSTTIPRTMPTIVPLLSWNPELEALLVLEGLLVLELTGTTVPLDVVKAAIEPSVCEKYGRVLLGAVVSEIGVEVVLKTIVTPPV